MDPYASVIIPSHDRAATLAAAVASVQRQTVPNIEILIVGDGATAEVTSVAQALAAADPRVRFHAFEKGPTDGGVNIDRAVHSAHSERIFFNDDDDVWLRQHVEVIGPLLETADIADTFPVSVGAMVTAHGQRLHGTLVNGENEHIRRLLASDRLKLTFDTHVAHRKSSYVALGSPRRTIQGYSVTALLKAFASASHMRWSTLATTTALSLHGAARAGASAEQRRAEIELWLARSAMWTPQELFEQVDFTSHLLRMLSAEAARAGDTAASYLSRYGIRLDRSPPMGSARDAGLPVGLNPGQRRSVDIAFALVNASPEEGVDHEPDTVLPWLLDCVLSSAVSVDYAQALLRQYDLDTAVAICARLRDRHADLATAFDLLETQLLAERGSPAEALAKSELLLSDPNLTPLDRTRLLHRLHVARGDHERAIQQLEYAWREKLDLGMAGLQLAELYISAARAPDAMRICHELAQRIPEHASLRQLMATLDQMIAGLRSVPQYRLSAVGLVNADGHSVESDADVGGHVDSLRIEDGFIFTSGWTVGLNPRRPIRHAVTVVNGFVRGVAPMSISRPDVATMHKVENVRCGFLMAARLPGAAARRAVDVQVFAITEKGTGSRLYPPLAPADT